MKEIIINSTINEVRVAIARTFSRIFIEVERGF